MRFVNVCIGIVALAVAAPSAFGQGNLIKDGGFEDPSVSAGPGYLDLKDGTTFGGNGMTGLTGSDQSGFWHNTSTGSVNDSQLVNNDASALVGSYFQKAYENQQFYRFSAEGRDAATLYQEVQNLTVGTTYTLTFEQNTEYEGGPLNGGVTLDVVSALSSGVSALGGERNILYTPPTYPGGPGDVNWELRTITFNATSSNEYIRFGAIAGGGDPGAIDDVRLTGAQAVPEPFTAILGISSVGLAVRRRVRKAE